MIGQEFIDRIEELRHNTYSNMNELQTNICPMVKEVYLNYQFEYWYDGYKYNLWEDDTHVYAVNEIPYCYDNDIKNTVFQDTLLNLVQQDKVWPFLLFINGAVIRWSDIVIIHDYDYSYMRINNIMSDTSTYATMVYFPIPRGKLRYGEDNDILLDSDVKGLYFDLEGHLIDSPEFAELSVRLEILDKDIYFNVLDVSDYSNNSDIVFENLPDGYVPTYKNIIMFSGDGLIINNPSAWISDPYNGAYTYFKFTIPDQYDRRVSKLILLYNTAHAKSSSHIYHRLEDLDKDALIKKFTSLDLSNEEDTTYWNDVMGTVLSPFDFDHKFGTSYLTNIANATKYITQYDYSLWNKIFIENSPIKSFQYTGAEFKRLADDKGYVRFSRRHSELIEDVAMMFLNSVLYENTIDISYTNNTINLPIFGILDDDHVEVILFTKCNNNILDIVVEDEQTPVYIHPEYNLEDCYIMSEECEIASYDVPESLEHRKQYICDVQSYSVDDNSNYKIVFEDPEYYGKQLKIVPKHQFRHYRFRQQEGQYKIILPVQFNYCHDINRFMVFVNGKKIDKTEFTVTIMNRYRPFDKLVLYLSTILDENDYVDVFYIPEMLEEKYKEEELRPRGYLYLSEPDNYPKFYSLSKYTTFVFVNGKKINPMDIKDVSMSSMLINPKLKSIYNVTVVEYISGSKDIAKFLYGLEEDKQMKADINYPDDPKNLYDINVTANDPETGIQSAYSVNLTDDDFTKTLYDSWKAAISNSIAVYGGEDGYDDIQNIFGPLEDVANPDKDYKLDYARLRAILYDVVVDYYLQQQEATTGSPFTYDFEMDEWFPQDNDPELIDGWTYYVDDNDAYYASPQDELYVSYYSDIIQCKLITLYPDHDKLLDYYYTDSIADTDDIRMGKRFYRAEY